VSPERVVDVLALVGDAVDNVPGVPGIGDKGARDLVREFGSLDASSQTPRRSSERPIVRVSSPRGGRTPFEGLVTLRTDAARQPRSRRPATARADTRSRPTPCSRSSSSPSLAKAYAPDAAVIRTVTEHGVARTRRPLREWSSVRSTRSRCVSLLSTSRRPCGRSPGGRSVFGAGPFVYVPLGRGLSARAMASSPEALSSTCPAPRSDDGGEARGEPQARSDRPGATRSARGGLRVRRSSRSPYLLIPDGALLPW